MSFRAPTRRGPSDPPVSRRTGPGLTTAPVPRTAPSQEIPSTAGSAHSGPAHSGPADARPRVAGRFRHDRAPDTWWWSPELFAVLGLDPCTTEPGTEALLGAVHLDDRVRALDAITAAGQGRACALEVRTRGGRAVVLVGEPEVDAEGRVVAVAGLCAELTAGRPPGPDGARVHELETEVEQLRAAMASRAVIEQAKGILMLLTSCRDRAAFDLLGHISSHTHRKVRDVARVLTESATGGRLPEEIRAILRDACPPTRDAP